MSYTPKVIEAYILALSKAFDGTPYTDEQKIILQKYAKRYGDALFEKVFQDFLANAKKKPLPADFKIAFSALPEKMKSQSYEYDYVISCHSCKDTGFCFLTGDYESVIAKCFCWHGKNNREPGFPQVQWDSKRLVGRFPVELFVPEISGSVTADKLAGSNTVEWWKSVKKISREFWKTNDSPGYL